MKSQREILGENLERLINKKGIDQKILAEEVGVSTASVSNWVSGLKYPRIDKIQLLADYFGVSHSDLVELNKPTNLIKFSPATVKVPVLGKIACGDPILAEENIKEYRNESPDLLPSGNSFYLEAFGDSMEPTIPNGSLVLIREQPSVEYGEIAAVLVNGNEEATLKRVRKQGNMVMLMPDNPTHDPYIITEDNPAKIIGKAIRVTLEL